MDLDDLSNGHQIKPLGSVLEYYGKSGKLRPDDSTRHDKQAMRINVLSLNRNKVGNLIAVPKFIEK